LAAVAFGIVTLLATATTPVFAQGAPAPEFGSPPSGEIPILYNDQHVYTKPDKLRKGRVLAALVRGKTILVPLRSMFEQMGATVSYNPSTKTVDVSKPGADVQVTVGKPEVVINGETRPLDVPPEIYHGTIVVPVRVISEGMGAYVLWVQDKHLVVVRYLPPPSPTPVPTAPPTPVPTVAPTVAPTQAPTPSPTAAPKAQVFIAADGLLDPTVYNEFSPGNKGAISPAGRIGVTVPFSGLSVLAEGDLTTWRYPHRGSTLFDSTSNSGPVPVCGPGGAAVGDQGCVTIIGGGGQIFVPSFDARAYDLDGRVGIGVANPNIYLVLSYDNRWENYGYPKIQGLGGGLEKVADYSAPFSFFGSVLYYPSVGAGTTLQYRIFKYQAGLTANIPHTPLFIEGGYLGDRGNNKSNAPSNFTDTSFFAGLGLHF
jgi:hypothetical protein